MPNQRANGQTLIGCHVDANFAAEIDRARNGKSRSDFLREALFEHLKSLGYSLPETAKYAPDRAGKGGPRGARKAALKNASAAAAVKKDVRKKP